MCIDMLYILYTVYMYYTNLAAALYVYDMYSHRILTNSHNNA